MNRLLYPYSLCLLLLLLHASTSIDNTRAEDLDGEESKEFIEDCQTNSTCGGIDIRYPFRMNSTPAYCGVQGLEVSCSAAGDAIVTLPRLGPCKIIYLYPFSVTIKLLGDEWARCPLQKLSSTNLTGSIYQLDYSYDYKNYILVNCSSEIVTDPEWITGPIPCLGNGSRGEWVYVAMAGASMDQLQSGCVVTGIVGSIGYAGQRRFGDKVQGFIRTLRMDLILDTPELDKCGDCNEGKQYCGFSRRRNQTACLMRSNSNLEGEEREEFIKDCETKSTCGGIDIRYPFRLNSTPAYCGVQGWEVSCSAAGDAMITLPRFGPSKIIKFDTYSVRIKLEADEWAQCPMQKLISINVTGSFPQLDYSYDYYSDYNNYILVNCSSEIAMDPEWITGPIPCLGNGSRGEWVYVAMPSASIDQLPSGCVAAGIGGWIGYTGEQRFGDRVQEFIRTRRMDIPLSIPESFECSYCNKGMQCGFSRRRNQIACFKPHGTTNIGLIVGTCIGGLVVVLASLLISYLFKRMSEKDREIRFKVEQFLATYGDAKPTRYSFSEIRKITMRFKNKLGQGGYGSVYKGELPNGIPVAVKMLESSIGEGQDFINEVATIGRIHHINITRLLGFCSEQSNRALVYEFMPNESLEKYIFSRRDKGSNRSLSMEKLSDIAIGIARGIEYLHQGCEQRILHFDIKPHNVLLDYDLNPKISDFGLAKLCSREISMVTMTAARGTMGYIAPEMYCRNFGTVSYKSDVYSFGMLLLEMIGGRKNHDPEIGRESEIYYPEWVYDRLVERQDMALTMEIEQNDGEILQKLSKVALWCIQWSPTERPSMTRVLQMLLGSSEEVQMPPKPFVSNTTNHA